VEVSSFDVVRSGGCSVGAVAGSAGIAVGREGAAPGCGGAGVSDSAFGIEAVSGAATMAGRGAVGLAVGSGVSILAMVTGGSKMREPCEL
jgi:hypothetical protein